MLLRVAHRQRHFPLKKAEKLETMRLMGFLIWKPSPSAIAATSKTVHLAAVPVCNQSFVHLCGAGEGTAAKANDVFVPEMGIRSKINHVAFLLPPNKNRAAKHDSSARSWNFFNYRFRLRRMRKKPLCSFNPDSTEDNPSVMRFDLKMIVCSIVFSSFG